MTVESENYSYSWTTSGTTDPQALPFPFLEPEHLQVVLTPAGGVPTTLVLNVDYSVTGDSRRVEASLIPLAAWTPGGTVSVTRSTPRKQETDYVASERFPAESTEYEFDRRAMIEIELAALISQLLGRALRVPAGETINELPAAALRALQYLRFGLDGSVGLSSGTADQSQAYEAVFTATEGQAVFALPFTPLVPVFVYANGVRLVPGDFSVAGTTLTLVDPRNDGDSIAVVIGEASGLAPAPTLGTLDFQQSGTGAIVESAQTAIRREVWADQYKSVLDADDSNCITRAVTALLAAGGGGVVRLSRRAYVLANDLTFTALNNVLIEGAGRCSNGTMIRSSRTTGDTITFAGCQHSGIRNVQFWPTVRKTSGFAVRFTTGCFACHADIRTDYGHNGVDIYGATETRVRLMARYMLGTQMVHFGGTASYGSYRAILEDINTDNPYPAALSGFPITWSAGLAITAGKYFVANGAVYQCVSGGVTGASAPSGFPSGTTPESVFTTDITNGTAKVRWVASSSLAGIVHDSYAYSLVIEHAALLNGCYGFRMIDTALTGSSYPIWATAANLECDHNYFHGIHLDRGEGFYDGGAIWVGSCLAGNGITIDVNYRGDVTLGPAVRSVGNAQHGLLRQAGPTSIRINGGEYADNSASAAATYHGITIAANAVDTSVLGARCGDGISVAGNNQGYGISIGNGQDKLTVANCNTRGNTTAGILPGSGHTNSRIIHNDGYNPVGRTTVSPGASPYTYTAGVSPETHYIVGGTVTDIKIGATTVLATTPAVVRLQPLETLTITYSVAPTGWIKAVE